MERVGEEQQAVAGKSVRREHRSRAPAHRAPAEDEGLRRDFAARVRGHGGDAFLQAGHGVRMAGPFLAVREVEANDVEPASAQALGHREHAAAGRCRRWLEDRGGFLFADSDPPRRLSAHCRWSRADARYFIRSLILASAVRAHSSSNWPPGAPLTPSAPIVWPPAWTATAPCA